MYIDIYIYMICTYIYSPERSGVAFRLVDFNTF